MNKDHLETVNEILKQHELTFKKLAQSTSYVNICDVCPLAGNCGSCELALGGKR